ncbi:arylamine N-acetyltransferase [Nocardia panacis]|uniref:Arylamine N-acetyltransferase n=1 Tax=Nocardia panacis TaxID=2340916 RepID=A0A3A4KAL7_9NOCA|nr:arylamine N-acetyltransferase [Nocardia panacis]RJO69196.1 arylamine N-acetyltransferase [Nocardia panacis]
MTTNVDPAYHWNGAELDLDAYLERIGYAGEPTPTPETLRLLHRAHTTALPFENFDAVLGRGVALDLAAVQDKMIRHRRGGYCFEHVTLFAAALQRFGFEFTAHTGRVVMGEPTGLRPSTHALLRVRTAADDRIWLCDVGFGAGPLEPYALAPDTGEFPSGDWRFRLEALRGALDSELWALHQFGPSGWIQRYTFTVEPKYRIDFEVGNLYVSTSPRSPFATRPYAQRFHPDVHHELNNRTWNTRYPDGRLETREPTIGELPEILREVFDIELGDEDFGRLEFAD